MGHHQPSWQFSFPAARVADNQELSRPAISIFFRHNKSSLVCVRILSLSEVPHLLHYVKQYTIGTIGSASHPASQTDATGKSEFCRRLPRPSQLRGHIYPTSITVVDISTLIFPDTKSSHYNFFSSEVIRPCNKAQEIPCNRVAVSSLKTATADCAFFSESSTNDRRITLTSFSHFR